jgi:hypothetical protein
VCHVKNANRDYLSSNGTGVNGGTRIWKERGEEKRKIKYTDMN